MSYVCRLCILAEVVESDMLMEMSSNNDGKGGADVVTRDRTL